jgi:hypothetical protein
VYVKIGDPMPVLISKVNINLKKRYPCESENEIFEIQAHCTLYKRKEKIVEEEWE